MVTVLAMPILEAAWQLQPHCSSCAYMDTCSRQALSTDDIMLLPHLTPGEHLELRTLGLQMLPQAAHWFQDEGAARQTILSPQQLASVGARVRALTDNRLEVVAETTSLYPANIVTAIFMHVVRDPRLEQLRVWGLYRLCRVYRRGATLLGRGRARSTHGVPAGLRYRPAYLVAGGHCRRAGAASPGVRGRRPPAVTGGDAGEL